MLSKYFLRMYFWLNHFKPSDSIYVKKLTPVLIGQISVNLFFLKLKVFCQKFASYEGAPGRGEKE